jgi:hypothetical protein
MTCDFSALATCNAWRCGNHEWLACLQPCE